MDKHRKYIYVLVLLCGLLYGCKSAAPTSSSSEESETKASVIQSAETISNESLDQEKLKSDATDGSEAENYEAYTGVWSEKGISHDQLIKDGGTEFHLTINNKNQVTGSLYSQQGVSERIAEIDNVTGIVKGGACEYIFSDDDFGGRGTLKIRFLKDEITIEVADYQMAESNASGFGITGTYQLTRADGSGDKKEQETEDKEQELFEEVYKRYYSNRSQEELLADAQARRPYLEKCSFYNEVQEYMEQIRQVRDISNVAEPLYLTDMKYYSNEDFKEVPPLILHLAKNEIYARHGYVFNNDDLNHYFMGQLWYEPTVRFDQFDQSVFNDYEKANLELLVGLDTYQEGKK
jgi:hypothetical protein